MIQQPFYRRIDVWKDTEKNAPRLDDNSKTEKYEWEFNYKMDKKYEKTLFAVVNKDLIDLGEQFLQHRPLVHNPSDDSFPGGCVATGSGAAEESLFRRTNYFRSLTLKYYPLKAEEAVYSSGITVFKKSEDEDFVECNPFRLDFVACPGIRHPILTEDGKLKQEDINILERKIELILQIAYKNGHEVVIISAIGCGAWKNPPMDVAEVCKNVLQRYNGVFKAVLFAIKQDCEKNYTVRLDSSRPDNYLTFKTVMRDM